MSELERFWAKVDKSGDCWMWTAGCIGQGYGLFHPSKTVAVLAHRYSYELAHGPLPDGMVSDHECHNRDLTCKGGKTCPHRKCVNPAHLRPKTNKQNLEAGPNFNAKKMRCPAGHRYTASNTRIHSNGARSCLTCARERDWTPERAERQRRRRAAKKKAGK